MCVKEFASPNLKFASCVKEFACPNLKNSPRVCGKSLPAPTQEIASWKPTSPRGLGVKTMTSWGEPAQRHGAGLDLFYNTTDLFSPPSPHTHALGGLGNSVFGNVYLMICAFASLYRSRGPSSRISHLQQQQQRQRPGGRARVQFWSTWFLSLSLPLSRFWFPL